ncbi:MAG: hypothetical protein WCV81_02535 [Microgenomates group bacterium]|jgi:hypothetical protein
MYTITGKSGSIDRDFEKIINSITIVQAEELVNILENFPKGNSTTHKSIKCVYCDGKKLWQYDLTWGDRVIYKVIDKGKIVLIYYIGDHKGAETFRRRGSV